MPEAFPKLSPALEQLIARGVLDRIPVTLGAYIGDQLRGWTSLFPAERSYFERLFALFHAAGAETTALFDPLREVERKMGVTEKSWPKGQFTLDQVDFLNRNAHYPEWRRVVTDIFGRVDPILNEEVSRKGWPRLSIVIAPPELPVGPDRMWQRIEKLGRRVAIDPPEQAADFVPLLLTGKASGGAPLTAVYANARKRPYDTWIIESGATLTRAPGSDSTVRLSYELLEPYRTRLMKEVDRVVHDEKIAGPKQLGARLKEMKVQQTESGLASDPVMAEFVRATLLAGNGTLLLNNTFVEWATVQAVRRARPSVVVASFGIRNKVKPFSGLLIYADQEKTNPIPTQMDTLGSYVDLEIFYQYILQEFEKYPEYKRNTAYVFAGDGMDQLFVIGPPDFPLAAAPASGAAPLRLDAIHRILSEWIGV